MVGPMTGTREKLVPQVSSDLPEERIDWDETIGWSFVDYPGANASGKTQIAVNVMS